MYVRDIYSKAGNMQVQSDFRVLAKMYTAQQAYSMVKCLEDSDAENAILQVEDATMNSETI